MAFLAIDTEYMLSHGMHKCGGEWSVIRCGEGAQHTIPPPCAHALWVQQNLPCVTGICAGGGIVTVQHLQFALTNAAGLHETIHQFVISESRLHLRPFCPSPSPVTICALMSCPAAWHAADPFIVENLIGLIHEGIF